jgi:glycosyltransferase involved in cell wall biosynthesis
MRPEGFQMNPKISIVIPTHDRCQMLLSVLAALARQTVDPQGYEVIVVADGCKDDTVSAIKGLATPFHLILIEQPDSGPGVARNRGAEMASAPILMFLDDDVEPEPQLVKAHLDAHKKWPGDIILGYSPFSDELDQNDYANLELRDFWDCIFAEQASVAYRFTFRDLITANISIQIKLFKDIGGFDERFSKLTSEDSELGLRLIKRHVRFRFASEAVGKHHAKRPLENNLQRKFNQGRAHVMIIRKHPEVLFSVPLGYIIVKEISNISIPSDSFSHIIKNFLFKLVWLSSVFADILDLGLQLLLDLSRIFKSHKLYQYFLIKLYGYKYLRGVQFELSSLAAAKQLAEEALNVPIYFNEIDIDLKTEFGRLEEILSRQPTDGARLYYDDMQICRIEPVAGAEPLRPPHIYNALYSFITNPKNPVCNNKELASLLLPFLNQLPDALFLDKRLSVNQNLTIQGWHESEDWNGIKTRWMMDRAILPIYSNKICMARMDFRAKSFCHSLTLEISVGDQSLGKWIIPTEFIEITAEIPLSIGLNILWLHVLDRCNKLSDHWRLSSLLNTDSRCLSIAFQNIDLMSGME